MAENEPEVPPQEVKEEEGKEEKEKVEEPASQQPPPPQVVKEMRRIQEKTEAPTDKAELIKYLSQRISQAEDALVDTEELLESEVKQRQRISSQIQQRNSQLQKLYEVDQRGLPDKIKQKLTEILTTTVSQKVDAQERLGDENTKNYQFKRMYDELKWQQKNITALTDEQKNKEEKVTAEIAVLEQQNEQHQNDLKEQEASFNEFKEKKELLENKYLQMKVALNRMGDIKAVLNRFFGSQDLFDQKMELKEQHVKRIQVPLSRESQNRQPPQQLKTQTKLKPLNYTAKNDDDDFWRGDFKGKY